MSNAVEHVWIPKRNVAPLLSKFNALSTRAAKNGLPAPKCDVLDETRIQKFAINSPHDTGRFWFKPKTINVEMVKVAYSGSMPVFEDWKFLASIEHRKTTEGESRNSVFGGFFLDKEERASLDMQKELLSLNSCPANCDHCELPRKRNQTFLLEHGQTGEVKQVGSTCIDDFLGEKTLAKALWYYEMDALIRANHVQDYVDNVYYGAGKSYPVELDIFVAQASLLIDTEGFVSRSHESEMATADLVIAAFQSPTDAQKKLFEAYLQGGTHKQLTKAADMIKFYCEIDAKGKDFIQNIQQNISRGDIDLKNRYQTGVIAFLPEGYRKEVDKQLKVKLEKAGMKDEHFGTLKQRGMLKLELLEKFNNLKVEYPYVMMKFKDDEGRPFTWKPSIKNDPNLEVGKTYSMKGTLTEHGEFSGDKYTRITRVSDVNETKANTPAPEFLPTKKEKTKVIDLDDNGPTP